jgi:ABC-type Fe3+ transport system substrate-binding protein
LGKLPLAILRLEEILAAQHRGEPIRAIYPLDAMHTFPIYVGVHKEAPRAAKKVVLWLLTPLAQNAVIRAGHYSGLKGMAYGLILVVLTLS